ncbi:hypothetical protein Tco_1145576 [Tanacetum coccineum]
MFKKARLRRARGAPKGDALSQCIGHPDALHLRDAACALRNFDLEVMEFESAQSNTTTKLPILPGSSSTNNINTANPTNEVSTVSTNVNTASAPYDLEQINEDDLEAMDLKWQLYLLSMRAKTYYQRTGKKIFINVNDTAGYQDNTMKQGNNKDTSSKAMLAIDGAGFNWSDMAEEHVQTNMALMAFSDFELNQTEFKAGTYKRGLATIEEQLVTFRKNEVPFSEEVTILKREVACKDYEIGVLKTEFEKVKQEKKGTDFKIAKFDNASKCLDKLLESQITDNSKKGLGYHAIASPHPLTINAPTKPDLSYYGLDEFKEPEFKGYGPRDTTLKSTIDSKENNDDSLIKEQVSEDENSSLVSLLNVDKEIVFHAAKKVEFVKPKNNEKPIRKSVRYAEMYRSQSPRGNQRYWNGQMGSMLLRPQHVGFGDLPDLMVHHLFSTDITTLMHEADLSKQKLNDKGFVDSGCSRHMTGNIAYLSNFKEFDRGYVTFGGGAYGGRTGKGTLKTDNLDF